MTKKQETEIDKLIAEVNRIDRHMISWMIMAIVEFIMIIIMATIILILL